MNVKAVDGNGPRGAVAVHAPFYTEEGVLRHFPPDVIEDVLAAQRAVIESARDL
jgi:hypothetical protein